MMRAKGWEWQTEFLEQFYKNPSGIWVVDGPSRRVGKTYTLAQITKTVPYSVLCTSSMRNKREIMERYDLKYEQVVALNYERVNFAKLVLVDDYQWMPTETNPGRRGSMQILPILQKWKNIVFMGTTEDHDYCREKVKEVHAIGDYFFKIPERVIEERDYVPKLEAIYKESE